MPGGSLLHAGILAPATIGRYVATGQVRFAEELLGSRAGRWGVGIDQP